MKIEVKPKEPKYMLIDESSFTFLLSFAIEEAVKLERLKKNQSDNVYFEVKRHFEKLFIEGAEMERRIRGGETE